MRFKTYILLMLQNKQKWTKNKQFGNVPSSVLLSRTSVNTLKTSIADRTEQSELSFQY